MMNRNGTDAGGPDQGTALRDMMSIAVADLHLPPGLADRVAGRDRRRTARIRLAGAVSAVAAVASAVTVTAVTAWPGGPAGPGGHQAPGRPAAAVPAQTAAYVLSRAASAQVDSSHLISVDHAPGGVTYTYVATQQQRIVSSKLDSAGQPYFQIGTEVSSGAYRETTVEYEHRVYSTSIASSVDDRQPVTISSFLPLQSDKNPFTAFQQALKAGSITVIGHRSLNGRDTILLRIKGTPSTAAGLPPDYIWLDAGTYLVAQTEHFVPWALPGANHRVRLRSQASWPAVPADVSVVQGKVTWSPVIQDVDWLPPTPGNLGLLTVTPPGGFTSIPSTEMEQKYLGPIS